MRCGAAAIAIDKRMTVSVIGTPYLVLFFTGLGIFAMYLTVLTGTPFDAVIAIAIGAVVLVVGVWVKDLALMGFKFLARAIVWLIGATFLYLLGEVVIQSVSSAF